MEARGAGTTRSTPGSSVDVADIFCPGPWLMSHVIMRISSSDRHAVSQHRTQRFAPKYRRFSSNRRRLLSNRRQSSSKGHRPRAVLSEADVLLVF